MDERAEPARRAARIEWLALAAAVTPIVVAVVRAAVTEWMPIGDAAYFTARSRDVFTRHWPLIGAWSSGSAVMETPVNNLGPLHLYALAPFTKASAYLGTAIGAAVLNASAVCLVWWVARRLFGPIRVTMVMAGTLLLMATLGLSWLIDARQQFALVLPFYALLWLTAAMWAGHRPAVPLGIATASLVAQTHLSYLYPAAGLTAVGVVAFAVRRIRGERRRTATMGGLGGTRRAGVVGSAVLVACWIPSVVDQLFGSGNLFDVARQAGAEGRTSPGLATGAQIVAGATLTPPFWLPGSIGDFLMPSPGASPAGATAAIAGWVALGAAVATAAWRAGRTAAAAVAGAVLAAVAAALVTATYIPISLFGLMPQNYYWAWAVGAFVTIGLTLAAGEVATGHGRAFLVPPLRRAGPAVALVALAGVVTVAAWPRYPLESVAYDEREARRVGAPLVEQLEAAFGAPSFPDTVTVDISGAFFGNNYMWVMLVELQRAGVEFTFRPGDLNLRRFGQSRCDAADLPHVLLLSGRQPTLQAGDEVVARVEGISAAELTARDDLDAYFAAALRRGTVIVDVDAVRGALGDDPAELEAVLADPDATATGLAVWLETWAAYGLVEMPADDWARFRRWRELEKRSFVDFQTVVLRTPGDRPEPDAENQASC